MDFKFGATFYSTGLSCLWTTPAVYQWFIQYEVGVPQIIRRSF
jgi:hypothetical protein